MMFNLKKASKLCNLLEQELFNNSKGEIGFDTVQEYVDFKETQMMNAPTYGCVGDDQALFMYALCIDYLKNLKFQKDLGKETLLNELYEIGKF